MEGLSSALLLKSLPALNGALLFLSSADPLPSALFVEGLSSALLLKSLPALNGALLFLSSARSFPHTFLHSTVRFLHQNCGKER